MGFSNWPQLYGQSLADVGDLAEELGKAGGGYYDVSRADRARSATSGSACRSRPAAG